MAVWRLSGSVLSVNWVNTSKPHINHVHVRAPHYLCSSGVDQWLHTINLAHAILTYETVRTCTWWHMVRWQKKYVNGEWTWEGIKYAKDKTKPDQEGRAEKLCRHDNLHYQEHMMTSWLLQQKRKSMHNHENLESPTCTKYRTHELNRDSVLYLK